MRAARAKSKVGFMFNIQKQPVLVSGGASLEHKSHFNTRTEGGQGGRKSAGVHLPAQLTLIRRGAMGAVFLVCYSLQLHHHHLHLL